MNQSIIQKPSESHGMAPLGLEGSGLFKNATRCTRKLQIKTISMIFHFFLLSSRALDGSHKAPPAGSLSASKSVSLHVPQQSPYDVDLMPDSRGGGTLATPWARSLLLLLALALSCQLAAAGDIISSSKLESCIADGSQVWFLAVPVLLSSSSSSSSSATAHAVVSHATADSRPC
jgi:hypothetical protein